MDIEKSVTVGDFDFDYPQLFTLAEFLEKYGEDNCTIMLQDHEEELYRAKISELAGGTFEQEADVVQNIQVALDAWKPCDDRPPTELETMANQFLNLNAQAQRIVRKHIDQGVAAAQNKAADAQAEVAAQAHADMEKKYEAPAQEVGPPVTEFQQEPELVSFEEQGQLNDEAVKAAQAGQEAALEENAEDYAAPTEFEEGGTEDVVTEQPPQDPVPRDSS